MISILFREVIHSGSRVSWLLCRSNKAAAVPPDIDFFMFDRKVVQWNVLDFLLFSSSLFWQGECRQ